MWHCLSMTKQSPGWVWGWTRRASLSAYHSGLPLAPLIPWYLQHHRYLQLWGIDHWIWIQNSAQLQMKLRGINQDRTWDSWGSYHQQYNFLPRPSHCIPSPRLPRRDQVLSDTYTMKPQARRNSTRTGWLSREWSHILVMRCCWELPLPNA